MQLMLIVWNCIAPHIYKMTQIYYIVSRKFMNQTCVCELKQLKYANTYTTSIAQILSSRLNKVTKRFPRNLNTETLAQGN